MQTIQSIAAMQEEAERLRMAGRTIAFVPTMGYLHRGHTSLIERARREGDVVVTSVFVNPTQFGPSEDFTRYPRDLARDSHLAEEAGTDILFVPSADQVYPPLFRTYVDVQGSSDRYEGAIRPGHFRGVATVVLKLFSIVRPHVAIFGQKDAQQCWLIRRMTTDLDLGITLIISPTVREEDGLAMSSRNTYLDASERKHATVLYRSLLLARTMVENGERNVAKLESAMRELLASGSPTAIDYVAFVDEETFEPVESLAARASVLAILVVRFRTTRLLDNMHIQILQHSEERNG